ncbi:MAG: hypothetical protein LC114_27630, partial [Bryobacterales bacterium]|nr:hypothetical protein [Bryobacterales bacterium]
MRALWLLLLLIPSPLLRAELQLWLVGATENPTTWAPVSGFQSRELPNGETLDINELVRSFPDNYLLHLRFELRNPAGNPPTPVSIFRLQNTVSQGAFTPLWNMLPGMVASGGKYTFEIAFVPPKPQEYKAILAVDNLVYTLRASASARTVMYERDTLGERQLGNGSTSEFGKVVLGQSYVKSFKITNPPGAQTAIIAPPALDGEISIWTLRNVPTSNRTVPPNGVYEFDVEFHPVRAGLISASLSVDGRTIKLVGEGMAGEASDFHLLSTTTELDSDSEAEARIELVSPAARAMTGTLALIFERDTGGIELPEDTVIRFIENGARSLGFTIPAGDTKAQFGDRRVDAARFKTGTTSGKIRLVATLGPWEHDLQFSIRSDAPKLVSGGIERGLGKLEVSVRGFDNTRSATGAVFRFFDGNGQAIGETSGVE